MNLLKTKHTLQIFTLIIVVLNIASIAFLDFFSSQVVNLVSSVLFLLYFSYNNIKDRLLTVFIILLIIADVFDLYYLKPYMVETYTMIKLLALSILSVVLFKRLKSQKLDNAFTALFLVIILINILIGYKTIDEAASVLNNSQLITIQAYWVTCILTGSLAAKYYFLNDSKKAVYFVVFTFLFIFADLSSFIANFFKVYLFFFFERIFYFLGFMCLGYYLFFFKKNENKKAVVYNNKLKSSLDK